MDKYIPRNEWYDAVFEPDESLDPTVISILGGMCLALVSYFKVVLKEHLPGGDLQGLTSEEVRGWRKENKFPETMFAHWKRLLQYMPNVSDYTAETFTLYACNHTGKYLASKSEEERRQIILQSRRDAPALRKLYRERRDEVQRARRENLEKERAEKEKKEQESLAEKERLVKTVEAIGGLWTTPETIEAGLERVAAERRGDKAKLDAIKSQILYRKKVMGQNIPAKSRNFSQGRKNFSLAEMTQRLKLIASYSKS